MKQALKQEKLYWDIYSAEEARLHMGEHDLRPLVHYDYLCME